MLAVDATPPRQKALPVLQKPQAPVDRASPPLGLFHRYQPRVGHPDFQALDRDAEDRERELLPVLERKSAQKTRMRQLLSIQTAARNYLDNRSLARAGREDLWPLYFIWTVHRMCNFRCTYCDDHRGERYPDKDDGRALSTDDGKRLLQVMRTRCPSVYFAGGEPTLRKDLPDLAAHAASLNFHPIILNTNGSALFKQLRLPSHRTLLANLDLIVVSVDSLDRRWLIETWGTDDPDEVFRSLLLLRRLSKSLGFRLAVNTVITPGRMQDARDVFDFASDLDIWFTPVPMNDGPRISKGLLSDPAYQGLRAYILRRKHEGAKVQGSHRFNARLLSAAPLSCRNTLKPHIDADGSLFWPCKAQVNVSPKKLSVLDFSSVDELWHHARGLLDPAGFHGPLQDQCGADCNWAQNYTTDAYAHGLAHPSSLLREVYNFVARS